MYKENNLKIAIMTVFALLVFYLAIGMDRQQPVTLTYSGEKVMVVSELAIPDLRTENQSFGSEAKVLK